MEKLSPEFLFYVWVVSIVVGFLLGYLAGILKSYFDDQRLKKKVKACVEKWDAEIRGHDV